MSSRSSTMSFRANRVRVRVTLAAALVGLAAGSSFASEPPNPNDLTQGTWELQPQQSEFCGREVPQQSIRHVVDAGWGLISVHWTGRRANGEPFETWYVYRYDGQKYPATIEEPASESITWKLVNPHRVEFTHWSKDDRVTQELVRTVSSDGQTMTQTTKYVGEEDAGKCVVKQVFRRK